MLCAFIVLVEMLRAPLAALGRPIAIAGAAAVLVGAALFVGAARRLAEHLPFLSGSQRMADALVLQLRKIGLPLLALLFFLFWTFVYLALWAIHPDDAFRGLDPIRASRTSSTTRSRPR